MAKQKLTKATIIENLHEQLGFNRNEIHRVIDSFFEEVKKGLNDDQIIELRGFGTFEIRTRKGREKARNPKTGNMVSVKTHGVAVFRPGKNIKEMAWDIRQGK
ncbi:MAG: integration host factor subunit beta [Spirochaetales bacterium]|nr:integration host factor subunit beta [Spirochaetales bacterium]